MKSWKTTIIGIGSAVAFLATKIFTHTFDAATDISIALGLAGIGSLAKDHDVTGTK